VRMAAASPMALTMLEIDSCWRSRVQKEERARWNHSANAGMRSRVLHLAAERSLAATTRTPSATATAKSSWTSGMTHPMADDVSSTMTGGRSGSRRSSAVGFLEEKLNLPGFRRSGTPELLYHGGRKQYLQRRKKYSIQERYGHPITESQNFGTEIPADYFLHPAEHGHKPVIKHFDQWGAAVGGGPACSLR
ncbi:unnamed protein product, partial [Polarella glacialis]